MGSKFQKGRGEYDGDGDNGDNCDCQQSKRKERQEGREDMRANRADAHRSSSSSYLFSCPGSSIPDLGQWVTDSVTDSVSATLEFWHKEWLLRLRTLQMFDQQGVQTKRQKDKKTTWQKDNMTKRQHDKKAKRQKYKDQESPILWRQGSFALLQCFFSAYLRGRRYQAKRRMAGYQRHIDNCTDEMSKFFILISAVQLNLFSAEHERKVDECRERIKRQQDMIRLDFHFHFNMFWSGVPS